MLIYDFEVFKQDWLCVICDLKTRKFYTIVNNKDELLSFYKQNENAIWAGYNNKNYDQYIVKAILIGLNPYEISNYIIKDYGRGFEYSKDLGAVHLASYDIYNGLTHSLKYYEGALGDSIEESSVPFDIDRKLSESELKEVIKYCTHDVEETVKVFFLNIKDFMAQLGLVKLSHPMYLSKTKTQMVSIILKASPINYTFDEFQIDFPECLRLSKYEYVKEWYQKNHDYDKSLETEIAGVPHVFAWGGLHGAIEKYHYKGNIMLLDVASLYPSLMINFDLLSRAVVKRELYKELRDKRLLYKKEHNPMHLPLKIALNSCYGAMKDKNNALYDPRQANRVCIYGQLLILDLIEHLEPYCKIINTNTDGVFITDYTDDVKDVIAEWMSRTGLTLEETHATEIWQKDVNNYVLKLTDGGLKTKGAYVKELTPLDYGEYPIINRAIKEALVNNIPVATTINSEDKLMEFQLICKITGKFDSIYLGDEELNLKCVRVFASNDKNAKGIFKRHIDTKALHKISNTPEHVFIDNTDVHGKSVPEYLDRQFYIDLANKRLSEFICNNDHTDDNSIKRLEEFIYKGEEDRKDEINKMDD